MRINTFQLLYKSFKKADPCGIKHRPLHHDLSKCIYSFLQIYQDKIILYNWLGYEHYIFYRNNNKSKIIKVKNGTNKTVVIDSWFEQNKRMKISFFGKRRFPHIIYLGETYLTIGVWLQYYKNIYKKNRFGLN